MKIALETVVAVPSVILREGIGSNPIPPELVVRVVTAIAVEARLIEKMLLRPLPQVRGIVERLPFPVIIGADVRSHFIAIKIIAANM